MQINTVLVLGATGQLGKILRAFWPEPQAMVCHSRSAQAGFVAFDPLVGPVGGQLDGLNIGTVICLSGVTPAQAKSTGAAYSDNTTAACAAIRLAARLNGTRVFLASSAAVYGAAPGVQREDEPCQPVSDYGRAKLEMEHMALMQAREAGVQATALRIGNVAGADAILGNWRPGMELDQLPDGTTPRRSYIGPVTLARTLYCLTQAADLPDTMNIAAPGTVRMGALLDAAGLAWRPRPAPDTVIASVALDTARLEHYVDFAAQDSAPSGLVSEWQQYKEAIQS